MIKNVIFDIGNVLVTFDWMILAKDIGFTEEELKILGERIIGDRWDEMDRGVMTEEEAVAYMKEVIPGMEEKFDRLVERIGETVTVYPYTDGWLAGLKEEGYHVYLLSNFPRNFFADMEKNKFHFIRYTEGKIISSHVKLIKPDPAIYKLLLDTYNLKPEESVFFDDRGPNVETANRLGLHGILFEGYEDAVEKFRELISNS